MVLALALALGALSGCVGKTANTAGTQGESAAAQGTSGSGSGDSGASGGSGSGDSGASGDPGSSGSSAPNDDGGHGDAPSGSATPAAPNTGVVERGAAAPDFSYTTLDGTSAQLSDSRGSVVLLNFWASWCGPCVREMPEIAALAEAYPKLTVLAVSLDDTKRDAQDYVAENTYPFTWVYDEGYRIGNLYPTDGIPYTIIIDKNGTVTDIFLGTPSDPYATYEAAIKAAGV